MKTSPTPDNNAARLQRMILWTALALAWAGEVASGVMKRFRVGHRFEQRLELFVPRLARFVAGILVIEALMLYGRGFLVHKRFSRPQMLRALIGPAIRRMMRGRTLAQTIARLAHVLAHRAILVARILARITRGLTHGHIAPTRAPLPGTAGLQARIVAALTCAPAGLCVADTS